jgi:hypothetical protein
MIARTHEGHRQGGRAAIQPRENTAICRDSVNAHSRSPAGNRPGCLNKLQVTSQRHNDGDNRAVAMDYPLAKHVIGGFVFIVLGTPGI